MADLSPDHASLLALARVAIQARDNHTAWRKDFAHAAEIHCAACDAVWEELERQLQIAEGLVPVLEHPNVKKQRIAMQLRSEIVNAVMSAIEEAMEDIACTVLEDDDG